MQVLVPLHPSMPPLQQLVSDDELISHMFLHMCVYTHIHTCTCTCTSTEAHVSNGKDYIAVDCFLQGNIIPWDAF